MNQQRKTLRSVLAGPDPASTRATFDKGPVWADWADAAKIPPAKVVSL